MRLPRLERLGRNSSDLPGMSQVPSVIGLGWRRICQGPQTSFFGEKLGRNSRILGRRSAIDDGYMMYCVENIEAHEGPNPPNDVVYGFLCFLVTRAHQVDPEMGRLLICTIAWYYKLEPNHRDHWNLNAPCRTLAH